MIGIMNSILVANAKPAQIKIRALLTFVPLAMYVLHSISQ